MWGLFCEGDGEVGVFWVDGELLFEGVDDEVHGF